MDLKSFIWTAIRKTRLGWAMLLFHPKSYLLNEGWFESFQNDASVDRFGNPLPWNTYAFIHFIKPRIRKEMRVFEYGCGYSTLWYAPRVKEIIAVEHHPLWAKKISALLPSNGKVVQKEGDEYINEVKNHGLFDIVIVDGILREQCAEACIRSLAPGGVIIWDNSDRDDFKSMLPFMKENGMKEINFYGISPKTFVPNQTSIIYQTVNCMGI